MLKLPEDIATAFVEAWNNNDAEGIASLFTEDAEFVNVTGLWWHNRQSILKAHQYGFQNIFSGAEAKIKRVRVKWLSDNTAIVHVKMSLSGQTPTSTIHNPGARQNIFLFVMQKINENWLCVSAQNTDILSGMETIIKDEKGNATGINYRKE